jgi:hypothetical protein
MEHDGEETPTKQEAWEYLMNNDVPDDLLEWSYEEIESVEEEK